MSGVEFRTEYISTATRYIGFADDPFRARRQEISKQMHYESRIEKRDQLQAECTVMGHVYMSDLGAFEDEVSHGRICFVCNWKEPK